MVDVARVLAYAYPAAIPRTDYTVADNTDGAGPFLAAWNPALGAQPSPAALATIAASAPYLAWITPAAVQARADALQPARTTLRLAAAQAIIDIDTFLALASPTTPQTLAAVKRLAEMMRAVINRLGQID